MLHARAVLLALWFAPTALAQRIDEVIVVEQRADIAARNRARPLLADKTLTLRGPLGVRDLCRLLGQATGDKLSFLFVSRSTKAEDIAALDVDLARATPLQVLALMREHLDLQAVWRGGLVCLVPKAEVKEATWLQVYDIRAAVLPLRDFPGPELSLHAPGEEHRVTDVDEEPKTTVSGFTGDKLVELVRTLAARDSWDGGDASIAEQRGILMVKQTERGHREVREALRAMGIPVGTTVVVEHLVPAAPDAKKAVSAPPRSRAPSSPRSR